ncbi:metal ABC transporter solute-binding protein, Zn/Mn family [Facklamia sp. 7083-14-GEN3]|uniref:metal ABC transporter solute-binding protein, Zn/Mn family n=1 Tax=Facklamia sp. 7083-14-GEN3 TaxID=2973478 RepID=UPI00215D1305|nr:zinc ABC transporter substrate-binding protein [Facklamia sp. 7083-14-GEN3]MCR8968892.1 zinc ABC transporter substrate-binding protein [Facklamia sp. 7083-14-GEN3]
MKKFVKVVVAMFLMLGSVSGVPLSASAKKMPSVTVTTSFLNDMVKHLAGDFISVDMIIPAGEDPHLYEPRPQDIKKLEEADLVLYHGLHFEGKMTEVLESLGVAVSENFDSNEIGVMDDEGSMTVDPHFWFNLDLYQQATERAAESLISLVPEHKEEIMNNTEDYKEELMELDKEVKEKIGSIPEESRFLITPHDAFNYFSRSYNIPVHAPQGVSTDSEVSNKDIDDTVDFIVNNKIKAIFAESTTDPARMEKLKEACAKKGFEVKVVSGEGQELFSDSLAPEGQDGDTFIDMVEHNVDLIVNNLK